jgi:signal transduction histidine kinase
MKATLVDFSHAIEDSFIVNKLPGVLFTGFQESRYWRREVERYKHLSKIAQQVCVFAGKPLPSDATYGEVRVTLPSDSPLRQEWFVVALTPYFSVVLAGLDRLEPVTSEARRTFDTLWTLDPDTATKTLNVLLRLVEHDRPDKAGYIRQAISNFPPRPPDTVYAMLLTQKMLAHLEQQHQIALQTIETLEQTVAERTRQITIEKAMTEKILQQLSAAVIVLDEAGNTILVNHVAEILLEGAWDLNQTQMPILLAALNEAVSNPEAIHARELVLDRLTLTLSSAKVRLDSPLTVVVFYDVSYLYALDQLRQKFLDAVSHKLRSPLSVIRMQLYLLRQQPQPQYIEQLGASIERFEEIVRNLLAVTETTLFMSARLALYAEQFTTHLMSLISVHTWANRVRIRKTNLERVLIHADINRLAIAVLDMIDLAARRITEDQQVDVIVDLREIDETTRWVQIRVIDQGLPLPPNVLQGSYQPFVGGRVEDTPFPHLNDVGLHIALTQRVVEQHDGLVTVTAEAGKGNITTIFIPVLALGK